MSDSISRQAAIDALIEWYGCEPSDLDYFKEIVERLPSADRQQGEWIGYEVPSKCSVCGHCWDEYVFGQEIWYDGSVPNYCPHCGARMKGADDEN